ncbi:type VI secretion protein IcmF/TssM N-terminal domain-containing protein [Pusillimonas sp. SM2304]|uniref:type VI secretion protein IcmF/TssM N-terminal domain-containing protein n=1 Tax=Pusillimonas sp. SM2304 TaxID=3073241 RepID=UPI002876DD97|nr:type VI secretion protein IcmF/TssM N-terminal domain-containing protein [Pusillimonas sp. SM2304]MDS1139760.1 type VI secretion protein IcmF/TssM N-terminal domain-containing protein [Pusillimonas sp. SM2304]
MMKKLFSAVLWVICLVLLAGACWVLGVYLSWPLWKSLLLFAGVIVGVLALSWLRRYWYAWRLRRRLARPAMGSTESTGRLDADWRAGLTALKQSRLSRFGSPLYVLPWFLALGPDDEARTGMLRRAAAREAVSGRGEESPVLQWWLLPGLVMLEPGASREALAPSASNWQRLLHWMIRTRRREPLNGLVLALSARWLLDSSDTVLADAGQALRKRVDELTRVYNARMPVYLVLTDCEALPGFASWAASLGEDARKWAMGYTGAGHADNIGEFIDTAFAHTLGRMRDLRIQQGIHANPQQDAFGLPERMAPLADRLDKVLRPAFVATPYAETPLLRGLFFTAHDARPQQQADWFSAGLFDDVLPAQRAAWQPLERWRHWRRLLRHVAVAGWLLGCVGVGVFLIYSANIAREQLAQASHGQLGSKADFSGGLSTDLHALHDVRHAIHTLNERPAWKTRWLPFQSRVTAGQKAMQDAYTDAFYREVLVANLAPLLERILSVDLQARPEKMTVALAQNLVRRTNLVSARLNGLDISRLPTSGIEVAALMPAGQTNDVEYVDGLLLGDMYRDYLSWQQSRQLLIDEQKALQTALVDIGLPELPVKWVHAWAALQPQLQPMRLTDFWDIPPDERLPFVPAALTVKGKAAVAAFLQEIAAATNNPTLWQQRTAQYEKLYLDIGLQSWYAFSDAFLHAPDLLADATARRTVLSSLMTSTGPYSMYMRRLSELSASLPADARPEWLVRAEQLAKLGGLVKLPPVAKQAGAQARTGLTARQNVDVIQQFGGEVLKALPQNTSFGQGYASLQADKQALKIMQDYLVGVRATTQPLLQGDGSAMAAAIEVWSYGHDPKVKDVPLIDAHRALEDLRKHYDPAVDPRTAVVWQILQGPLEFTLDYAARNVACSLQSSWNVNVRGTVQGVTDRQLADTLLFGEQGQVNVFLDGDVKHFVDRDGTRYLPRKALDGTGTVPLNGQFYAFASLAQLRKATVAGAQLENQRVQESAAALKDQAQQLDEQIAKLEEVKGNVTLSTEPPLTNADARERPERITLSLQCAGGPVVLENLNFSNSQVFTWSMSQCADTQLRIKYEGFEVGQHWSGADGFVRFLQEYASGKRRYTPADFPDSADAMQQAGVEWLDVVYRQSGQEAVLQAFAEADTLHAQAREVKDTLSAMQQMKVAAPDEARTGSPPPLPDSIITMCMGPANTLELYTIAPSSGQDEAKMEGANEAQQKHAGPEPKPVLRADTDGAGEYAVQVGVFEHPDKVRAALEQHNYQVQDDPITLKSGTYRNIRAGGFDSQRAADEAARDIARLLRVKPYVIRMDQ